MIPPPLPDSVFLSTLDIILNPLMLIASLVSLSQVQLSVTKMMSISWSIQICNNSALFATPDGVRGPILRMFVSIQLKLFLAFALLLLLVLNLNLEFEG